MKKILLLIFLVINYNSFAQKEASIWYFGEYAGLDFNSGTPIPLLDGQLETYEGCATIADSNGNLLFYTDGITVWNKNHKVMQNGTGLLGDISSTHSALIVPKPETPNIYYIFTVDAYAEPNGLNYSEVDMNLESGLGAITSIKNVNLETPVPEKVTAIKHNNGIDYWVVSHKWESDEFISYKVTKNGVTHFPVISKVGSYIGNSLGKAPGAIKISPNGKKIAVANVYNYSLTDRSNVELFDFDTATGKLSNPITIAFNANLNANISYRGIEFSPNSELLYFSESHHLNIYPNVDHKIYQVNLKAGDETAIINSRITINQNSNRGNIILQQAIDGKIYVTVNEHGYLDIINNPNQLGNACNYQLDGVYLGGRECKIGLPPFIQSYFNTSFTFENVCYGDSTLFKLINNVDTAVWNFGDTISGVNNTSNLLEPTHTFSASGTYNVKVSVIKDGKTAVYETEVIIYEQPTATLPTNILQCDDNNDGNYQIDLTQQNNSILNGQDPTIFAVKYYKSLTDLTINTEIPDPSAYTNQSNYGLETIYAKVYNNSNKDCFATTNFTYQVFESPTPSTSISSLEKCDNTSIGSDTDGFIEFDLTEKETEILNGQSNTNFNVRYFEDSSLSSEIFNYIAYPNTSTTQTIYVLVENKQNISCNTTTSFQIQVNELPAINNNATLKQCDNADINGFSTFNLEEAINKITSNAVNETISFFTSFTGAFDNDNSFLINNPTSYLNPTVSNSKVWARVENNKGCFRVSEIDLFVSTTQIPASYQKHFYECDDYIDTVNNETDGIATFDFSSTKSEIEAIFPTGQQLIINYYRNEQDAIEEKNAITDISNYRNIGYPNTQTIYIRVDSKLDNDCLGLGGHITLNVEPIPIAHTVAIERQCDDDFDGSFPFNTSTIEQQVLNGQTNMIVSYLDENGNWLPSPLPNPFNSNSQTITITVTDSNSQDSDGACSAQTTLEFIVDKKPVANPVLDLVECDDDYDGFIDFDTSHIQNEILNGQTDMRVSYFDENGNSLTSPLPNPFNTNSQTISVLVENTINNTCTATNTINFIVNPKPRFDLQKEAIVCLNLPPIQINIENPSEPDLVFSWKEKSTLTEISNQEFAEFSNGGVFIVTATSKENCTSFEQEIEIIESSIANFTSEQIEITDDSANNIIEIITHQLGVGAYEFAIQKEGDFISNYQDSPIFDNLTAGIYTVFVNDKNYCGEVPIEVSVIGYPKFFTPNNDGLNDYWNVIGVNENFYSNSLIYIFDRFGKNVAKIDPKSEGWNGYFKAIPLPSSDYWFSVQLIDNNGNSRIKKGHFSLIRN